MEIPPSYVGEPEYIISSITSAAKYIPTTIEIVLNTRILLLQLTSYFRVGTSIILCQGKEVLKGIDREIKLWRNH